jgi:hypothetical protein
MGRSSPWDLGEQGRPPDVKFVFPKRLSSRKPSANDRRQGCANALGEIRRAISRVRGPVDQGAPPQFVKRQRSVYPTRVVEVAIYQPIEEMASSLICAK